MSKKGSRKSVSMRDYEYVALGLYMERMNEQGGRYSRTSILSAIMIGDLAPVPMELIESAKVIAKEESLKRRIKSKENNTTEDAGPIGGGIFTF